MPADGPPGDGRNPARWKQVSRHILRIAPWVIFGPITGFLSNRALRCLERGETALAWLYLALNVSILIALPTLTALIAASI
jgi:hypothetical protein